MCHAKNLKIQGRVWVFGQIDTTRNCYTPTYESTYHCTFGWKALHHGGETRKLVSWRMRGQVASFPETLLHQDNPWIILTVGINWFVDWGKAPKPCLSAPSCKFSHPSHQSQSWLKQSLQGLPWDLGSCKFGLEVHESTESTSLAELAH